MHVSDLGRAPDWDQDTANALLLVQAARFQALANLLQRKGIISIEELQAEVRNVVENEKDRLIDNLTPRTELPPA